MENDVVKLDYKITLKAIIFLVALLIGISIESRMLQIILGANDTLLVNTIEKTLFVYLLLAVGLTEYGLNFKNVLVKEGDHKLLYFILSLFGSFIITYVIAQPSNLTTYLLPLLSNLTPNHELTAHPTAIVTIILALIIVPLHNIFLYYRFMFQGLINNNLNIVTTIIFTLAMILLHNYFSNQLLFIAIISLYFFFLYLKTKSTLILLINNAFINLIILLKIIY